MSLGRTLERPILVDNPITVQLLGLCSALAVTKNVSTALVMSAALGAVLVLSNAIISLLRRHIPRATRLVLQITIIASLVVVTDQIISAFAPGMSRRLSIFVSLIITNCIVLGRAEAFAMTHGVLDSMADAVGNALGYGLLLTLVGGVRELLGAGTLLGFPVLRDRGWFEPIALMHLAPAGFFLIALFIGASHALDRRPRMREPSEGGEP